MRKLHSIASWKAKQRSASPDGAELMEGAPQFLTGGDVVTAGFTAVVAAVEGESRALDFTISTASVDRDGDTIAVEGWKLDSFRKNPRVLWSHDPTMLPVGKAENVRIEDGKLKSRVVFTPEGLTRFNDTVFEMLKGGFLSATSVGFMPLKWNFVDDAKRGFGVDFLEQELLEFSIVNIPSNRDAGIERSSLAIAETDKPKDFWRLANAKRRLITNSRRRGSAS